MSEALTWLAKARPEAMGHYLKFLKDAGRHLDPKTRNLISVITKVHSQTERGFRQYLGRALREGCTPVEVVDALLMAFPALGLAKIVWAVDIILEMKLPGFDPESIAAAGTAPPAAVWHDVMAAADVQAGRAQRVECEGRGLFVWKDDAGIRVYDSRCPHQSTDIPELALAGRELTCPKHGWAFDVASGACVRNGNQPLKRYESKVEGERLLVLW